MRPNSDSEANQSQSCPVAASPAAPESQTTDEQIAKLERVSRWINKFPIPTDGATAMMCLLRDVKEFFAAQVARPLPTDPRRPLIDVETVLVLQRLAGFFEDVKSEVTPLARGDGVRNMTFADVHKRVLPMMTAFNAERAKVKNTLDQLEDLAEAAAVGALPVPAAQADPEAIINQVADLVGTCAFDEVSAPDLVAAFRTALGAALPAPVVAPTGWKWVPIVPTKAMTMAVTSSKDGPNAVWGAMIAVSPAVEVARQPDEPNAAATLWGHKKNDGSGWGCSLYDDEERANREHKENRMGHLYTVVGLVEAPSSQAAPTEQSSAAVCPKCKGERGEERAFSSTNYGWVSCSDCDGTGRISAAEWCKRCDTSGILPGAVSGSQAAPDAKAEEMLVPKWAGQFDSHQQWVNKAQSRLKSPSYCPAICVDAKGRRCSSGADMARARDEGAFPVRYFWECELVNQAAPAATAELTDEQRYTLEWIATDLRMVNLNGHAGRIDAILADQGAQKGGE